MHISSKSKIFLLLLAAAAALVFASGCAKKTVTASGSGSASGAPFAVSEQQDDGQVSDADAISEEDMVLADAIIENIGAFNTHDVETYLNSLAPAANTHETRCAYIELTQNRDIYASFDEEDFEVTERTDSTATVIAAQIMTYTGSDGSIKSYRYLLEHKMALINGRWLITSSSPVSEKEVEDETEAQPA